MAAAIRSALALIVGLTLLHHSPSTATANHSGWPRRTAAFPEVRVRHMRHLQEPPPPVWPLKKEADVDGELIIGGLMMVHEREDKQFTCGKINDQGGLQTVEMMLYTLDRINERWADSRFKIGALVLDDCDKDTYGLEMALDFIKGKFVTAVPSCLFFFVCPGTIDGRRIPRSWPSIESEKTCCGFLRFYRTKKS